MIIINKLYFMKELNKNIKRFQFYQFEFKQQTLSGVTPDRIFIDK